MREPTGRLSYWRISSRISKSLAKISVASLCFCRDPKMSSYFVTISLAISGWLRCGCSELHVNRWRWSSSAGLSQSDIGQVVIPKYRYEKFFLIPLHIELLMPNSKDFILLLNTLSEMYGVFCIHHRQYLLFCCVLTVVF